MTNICIYIFAFLAEEKKIPYTYIMIGLEMK